MLQYKHEQKDIVLYQTANLVQDNKETVNSTIREKESERKNE